jgi:hypothetical protein
MICVVTTRLLTRLLTVSIFLFYLKISVDLVNLNGTVQINLLLFWRSKIIYKCICISIKIKESSIDGTGIYILVIIQLKEISPVAMKPERRDM